MNYDLWGSWSPDVGPNAALNDTCAPPQYQQGSAVSAVRAWTSASLPRNQLVLGVGSYGHSFLVNESVVLTEQAEISAYLQFEPDQPRGDSSDGGPVWVFVVRRPVGEVYLISGVWLRVNSWTRKFDLFRAFITDTMNAVKRYILDWPFPTSSWTDAVYVCDAAVCLRLRLGYAMWEAARDFHNILIDSTGEGGRY